MEKCKVCNKFFVQNVGIYKKKSCSTSCSHILTSIALKGRMPKNIKLLNANKNGSGNPMWGKKQTPEHIESRASKIRGENHGNWKGDNVGYCGLHDWLRAKYGKPFKCENIECKKEGKIIFHWANLTGEYKRIKENWGMLCITCHNRLDKGLIKVVITIDGIKKVYG